MVARGSGRSAGGLAGRAGAKFRPPWSRQSPGWSLYMDTWGAFFCATPEPGLRAQAEEPQGIALGEPLNVISRPADLPDRPGHTLPYASELCTQYRRRGLKKCAGIV